MQKLILKVLLVTSLSLLPSSCAHVVVQNAEWCGDMGDAGASCFNTLSDNSRDLTKSEWDAIRFGQVCTSKESITNWKTAILKLCKYSNICTFDSGVAK